MHNLEIQNGKANMAYAGETPWHGLGTQVDESVCRDIPAFLKAANMDTDHELVQLVTSGDTANGGGVAVDRYAVRRSQDMKIVGNVGARYEILQNREAFSWFTPFLDLDEAHLHTAGVLADGAKVWILAKLNKEAMEIAKDDLVEKFLLLSHSHDGSLAVRVGFTPTRVVCQNTLSMAHKGGKLIRVKHSKNVKTNLENIRETMNLYNQEFEATAEQYRLLARKSVNQTDLRKYIKLVFAQKYSELASATDEQIAWFKEEGHDKDIISTRLKHQLERVSELFETGKGNTLPSVKGTYWAAYNGVTQYLSYENGNNADSRLSALWYGSGADMNRHALETALTLAA